jgi:hypothetical protein
MTYERVSFQAMANKLFNAAPTLKTKEANHSVLVIFMSPFPPLVPVDIARVPAETPEKNVATVKMFVRVWEDRSCSWPMADTPTHVIQLSRTSIKIELSAPTEVNSFSAVAIFSKSRSRSSVNWWM